MYRPDTRETCGFIHGLGLHCSRMRVFDKLSRRVIFGVLSILVSATKLYQSAPRPCGSDWPKRAHRWVGRQVALLAESCLQGVACLHLMPQPKSRYANRIELLQGTLDMLILKTRMVTESVRRFGRCQGRCYRSRRFALPSVTPAGAPGLGFCRLEEKREQSESEVLPDYGTG